MLCVSLGSRCNFQQRITSHSSLPFTNKLLTLTSSFQGVQVMACDWLLDGRRVLWEAERQARLLNSTQEGNPTRDGSGPYILPHSQLMQGLQADLGTLRKLINDVPVSCYQKLVFYLNSKKCFEG